MTDEKNNKTHFGYKNVNSKEKPDLVKEVFDSVSNKYDLMNDLMSLGIHRLWKKATIQMSNLKKGDKVLDVAGGTGDLAILFSELVGDSGKVYLSDINEKMLEVGRDRVIDSGCNNIKNLVADAENLPFQDEEFDCISIAFGIRNVTNKEKALKCISNCNFNNLKKLEDEKGFSEAITKKGSDEKIKFFNLGKDNYYRKLLNENLINKMNNLFQEELVKFKYE